MLVYGAVLARPHCAEHVSSARKRRFFKHSQYFTVYLRTPQVLKKFQENRDCCGVAVSDFMTNSLGDRIIKAWLMSAKAPAPLKPKA